MVSSSKLSLLAPQGEDSSLPYPAPAWMGSLPREPVLHELLQCESFPWASVFHILPRSFYKLLSLIEQASVDANKHLTGEEFGYR